ncbi:MAG: hypothetical protein LBS16_04745 [Prevotellaceae bacterium]|jgi:hypothetical protein|nr:hypothetical protein [Prevotellaceae bacterium]
MKTKFILVSLTAIIGLVVFLVSCSKDDEMKSCNCTEHDGYGYSATRVVAPASFGASNCSDLELKLKTASGGEFYYTCN